MRAPSDPEDGKRPAWRCAERQLEPPLARSCADFNTAPADCASPIPAAEFPELVAVHNKEGGNQQAKIIGETKSTTCVRGVEFKESYLTAAGAFEQRRIYRRIIVYQMKAYHGGDTMQTCTRVELNDAPVRAPTATGVTFGIEGESQQQPQPQPTLVIQPTLLAASRF